MSFTELNIHTPLLKALEDLDYIYPTPVQREAYPVIMSGRDVVAIAQTGTGKTFAYLLPILRQLKYSEQKHPRVLIIVPTRELVQQVEGELKKLSKYLSLRIGAIFGGANINKQKALVFNGLDILISTPGRLIDLASVGAVRLNQIQKIVIDEVDEMLEQEFRAQLSTILEFLPPKRQHILFSATLTNEVERLFESYFNNPVKIEIAPHGTPLEKIEQLAYQVPNFGTKTNLLQYLLQHNQHMQKILVFTSTIKKADQLLGLLHDKEMFNVGILHSRKSQNQRFESLRQFNEEEIRVLIATDVAARGLDVTDVTHVINFDTPAHPNDYLHRIGRTGRAGKEGVAITFVNAVEEDYLQAIEQVMNKEITILDFPDEVSLSRLMSEDEKPQTKEKDYMKSVKRKGASGAAFHEKKDKNKKTNSGGLVKKLKAKGKFKGKK
ncbi:MAG: DEAD/DEAH box helicase [Bacteroidia bacterium]|jgi:ATP-dependent RNA helicase RhlE|nr:DEAD/DEAH box helicase [Bacteroidia bacterium]